MIYHVVVGGIDKEMSWSDEREPSVSLESRGGCVMASATY